MNYYFEVLKKYFVTNGRARRKEYWMFFLFNLIIGFALGVIESMIGIPFEPDRSTLRNRGQVLNSEFGNTDPRCRISDVRKSAQAKIDCHVSHPQSFARTIRGCLRSQ